MDKSESAVEGDAASGSCLQAKSGKAFCPSLRNGKGRVIIVTVSSVCHHHKYYVINATQHSHCPQCQVVKVMSAQCCVLYAPLDTSLRPPDLSVVVPVIALNPSRSMLLQWHCRKENICCADNPQF